MDASRFDAVSKLFAARRLSRRQAMKGVSAGAAAATLTAAGIAKASAQDATPVAEGGGLPEYLFVQSFEAGRIVAAEGDAGRYTVSLDHGLGQTIYFADRPDRTVGAMPTDKFLDYIGFTPENPPNAALVLQRGPGDTDIAVVELFDPIYDTATSSATYTVQVLQDYETTLSMGFHAATSDLAALDPEFGAAHLFIDGISDCPSGNISCHATNEDGSLGDFIGTLPGEGTMGYCAGDEDSGACFPCESPDPTYWYNMCNQTYEACNGNCFVWDFCSRDAFISSHTLCKNSHVGGTWIGW